MQKWITNTSMTWTRHWEKERYGIALNELVKMRSMALGNKSTTRAASLNGKQRRAHNLFYFRDERLSFFCIATKVHTKYDRPNGKVLFQSCSAFYIWKLWIYFLYHLFSLHYICNNLHGRTYKSTNWPVFIVSFRFSLGKSIFFIFFIFLSFHAICCCLCLSILVVEIKRNSTKMENWISNYQI